MADLQQFTCPVCGAPANIDPGDETFTCQYCHNSVPLPRRAPPPQAAPPAPFPQFQVSVQASQVRAPKWIALVFLLPFIGTIAAAGAGAFSALRGTSSTVSGISLPGIASIAAQVRFDDRPFLFDANGDGTTDILGKSSTSGESAWIIAYDGRDGKELWRSAALTKEATDSNAVRTLAGGVFISVDSLGKVQAYSAKTGQPAWASLVSDVARSVCQGDDFVRITTSDKASHDLSLASGQKLADRAKAACRPVPSSSGDDTPGFRMVSWGDSRALGLPDLHDIDGMRADRALAPNDGGRAFMLGSRSKGTEVAMIAAVEGKRVVWKTLVPGVDPLTTDVNVTTQIAASAAGRVAVPYDLKGSKGVRMAAFDAATGNRLWDVAVHDKSQVDHGIAMTATDVYYATWTAVYVLRADTGAQRFRIGTEL